MKKKFDGLGLCDPEATKTNLLCKWIVKAMDYGESKLQLMPTFRLASCNP